jgi:hypothetical protein
MTDDAGAFYWNEKTFEFQYIRDAIGFSSFCDAYYVAGLSAKKIYISDGEGGTIRQKLLKVFSHFSVYFVLL